MIKEAFRLGKLTLSETTLPQYFQSVVDSIGRRVKKGLKVVDSGLINVLVDLVDLLSGLFWRFSSRGPNVQ